MNLKRTSSSDPDFIELVKLLDADLAIRDGDEHDFYHQYNGIDLLKNVVVAYHGSKAVACGAIKELEPGVIEVKRMYTLPEFRGKGIGSIILAELEKWAVEMNFSTCRLETGKRMPEAIAMYNKNGYFSIPNYGQYAGKENSVCFEKRLLRSEEVGR